jgi:hypothetical protein
MASLRDIVGGLNFPTFSADTDDLIRSAQTGNLGAYKELIRRGEKIPPPGDPVGRFGSHGRPGGAPMPGLEQPAYLDRGISRDMSRPASQGTPEPQGLLYMSAINPQQQEAPSYLGQNMMTGPQQSRGDQTISNLAGGHDAAGVIQRGASAADEVAGVGSPADVLPAPIKSLVQAFESDGADQPDEYENMAGKTIQDLLSSINPERNKNMALAQAGFAMAGSGSPYFLQGVGIGGQAGIKSYNEAQDRDMEARVRAGKLGTELSQNKEAKRANRAGEKLEVGRLQETGRSNVAQEGLEAQRNAEAIRANRATESINRAQLGISSQNAATAAGQLKIAQDDFALKRQQYQDGLIDDKALKKAQIDYTKAQAEAAKSLSLDRSTDLYIGKDDDVLYSAPKGGGKAVPILDEKGEPFRVQPKASGETAAMKNAKYYADIGLFPSEKEAAAAQLQGKMMTPDRRIAEAYRMADSQMANHPELIGQAADAQREEWAQNYYEILGGDSAPGAATATPPAKAAPQRAAPTGQRPTATNPQTGEKLEWDGKAWVPVK